MQRQFTVELCHRKLLRSSTSALEGLHMHGDSAKWHLLPHSSPPLRKRPNNSFAPYRGALAGGIKQWLCVTRVRWTMHLTHSGASHRTTFQSPPSTIYIKAQV